MRSTSKRLRVGGAIAATSLSLLVGLGGAAYAQPGQGDEHRNERSGRPGEARGQRDGRAAAPTEETDANDGGTPNNVEDSGDNEHPSGNDRSTENGRSENQGRATAEPDQNGTGPERDTGGPDRPAGTGGADLADQDGNNGCGNDDDFEDDNEGRCGKPAAMSTPPPKPDNRPEPKPEVGTVDTVESVTPIEVGAVTPAAAPRTRIEIASMAETQVAGVVIERPAVAAGGVAAVTATPAAVAPAFGDASVRAAVLARTGLGTGAVVLLALTLIVIGFALTRRPKVAHVSA